MGHTRRLPCHDEPSVNMGAFLGHGLYGTGTFRVTEASGEPRRHIRNASRMKAPKLSFPVQRWRYL